MTNMIKAMLTAKKQNSNPLAFYAGVFLLCMSVLMLQIVQTRIQSVSTMYFMAFFSISMAMLGLTAGSLGVYFWEKRFGTDRSFSLLSIVTSIYAFAIVIAFLGQIPLSIPPISSLSVSVVWIELIFVLALPFVFAGAAVSIALTRSPFPYGIVYGIDLAGAALGCLLILPLLNAVDGPSALFVVAAIACLSSLFFAWSSLPSAAPASCPRFLLRPGKAAFFFLAAAALNASFPQAGLRPIFGKAALVEDHRKMEFEKWNSFSRIAAGKPISAAGQLWGPSPLRPKNIIEQRLLNIDGLAGTFMPKFSGKLEDIEYLRYDVTNLAYAARSSGRAAIIGVGGGRDMLSAWLFGFRDIVGIEVNRIFIDLLTNPLKLREYAGIADLPGVRFAVDEGRSWFSRTTEKFDLIQMSMIDTWAATGSGAFSLSENGLYTVEGWKVFLSALYPNGLFTVSRWHSKANNVEIGRTVSLAVAALFDLGVTTPQNHVFIASSENLASVIISRSPLNKADVNLLIEAANRYKFDILAYPESVSAIPVFSELLSAKSRDDLDLRADAYMYDVSAPTDSTPFFFNQIKVGHMKNIRRSLRNMDSEANLIVTGNIAALNMLILAIILSALVVMQVIIIPASSIIDRTNQSLFFSSSAYFLLIGLGFMFVEMGLIQRLSIFLGHPTYGLGIALFSLILWTGIGSILSERFPLNRTMPLVLWLGGVASFLFALPTVFPYLTHPSLQGASLALRACISVSLIAPAGLLMGFGFPTGIRMVMRQNPTLAPWLWSLNGAAGVLAGGLATLCSLSASTDATIRIGGLFYLLLLWPALKLSKLDRNASNL